MQVALLNSNRMRPPIAPLALDYLAGALAAAGIEVAVVDTGLADEPEAKLRAYFARQQPELVGVTFRNLDDCFLASGQSFLPDLAEQVGFLRGLTAAPVVLGGTGFALAPEAVLRETGADFGILGSAETALPLLVRELGGKRRFADVPGLLWREGEALRRNQPVSAEALELAEERSFVDNAAYFAAGGQLGFETKRGCDRQCLYCPEPHIRGRRVRRRDPAIVAQEVAQLAGRCLNVLHTCDSEFNLPYEHGLAVCEALAGRGLDEQVCWYAYLAVTPFDEALAAALRRAGCVGVNFTADSANEQMLSVYGHRHSREDLARAVQLCKQAGIAVMLDLMIGGPGETPETVADSVAFWKAIDPDCAGAALGLRIYPETPLAQQLQNGAGWESLPGIRRRYDGPIDLTRPTFYVSPALGPRPAALVRDMIAGDERFFAPRDDADAKAIDHNYNDNADLAQAIANGARGAYWDILRRLRGN